MATPKRSYDTMKLKSPIILSKEHIKPQRESLVFRKRLGLPLSVPLWRFMPVYFGRWLDLFDLQQFNPWVTIVTPQYIPARMITFGQRFKGYTLLTLNNLFDTDSQVEAAFYVSLSSYKGHIYIYDSQRVWHQPYFLSTFYFCFPPFPPSH